MEVEHEHVDKLTPFEQRYLPLIAKETDPNKRAEMSQKIAKVSHEAHEVRMTVRDTMDPHQGFIDAYNQRAVKQNRDELRRRSQQLYNEDGKRFGRNWDYEGYRQIHDPLSKIKKSLKFNLL